MSSEMCLTLTSPIRSLCLLFSLPLVLLSVQRAGAIVAEWDEVTTGDTVNVSFSTTLTLIDDAGTRFPMDSVSETLFIEASSAALHIRQNEELGWDTVEFVDGDFLLDSPSQATQIVSEPFTGFSVETALDVTVLRFIMEGDGQVVLVNDATTYDTSVRVHVVEESGHRSLSATGFAPTQWTFDSPPDFDFEVNAPIAREGDSVTFGLPLHFSNNETWLYPDAVTVAGKTYDAEVRSFYNLDQEATFYMPLPEPGHLVSLVVSLLALFLSPRLRRNAY